MGGEGRGGRWLQGEAVFVKGARKGMRGRRTRLVGFCGRKACWRSAVGSSTTTEYGHSSPAAHTLAPAKTTEPYKTGCMAQLRHAPWLAVSTVPTTTARPALHTRAHHPPRVGPLPPSLPPSLPLPSPPAVWPAPRTAGRPRRTATSAPAPRLQQAVWAAWAGGVGKQCGQTGSAGPSAGRVAQQGQRMGHRSASVSRAGEHSFLLGCTPANKLADRQVGRQVKQTRRKASAVGR